MSTAGAVCAGNATQRKNSHAKRKTDQLHHSTRENISQLSIPTKFIPLLPSGEKLGLVIAVFQCLWHSVLVLDFHVPLWMCCC
jgi:hypothetical protein